MKNELPHVLALFPGVRSRLSGSSQQQVDIQKDLVGGGMFALFLIPALYLLLDDFKTWWKEAWTHTFTGVFKKPLTTDTEAVQRSENV